MHLFFSSTIKSRSGFPELIVLIDHYLAIAEPFSELSSFVNEVTEEEITGVAESR